MDIFGGKRGFLAFWRHFRPFEGFLDGFMAFFEGNMVGKWTNEPCSGVDEVVNTFWVLTLSCNAVAMWKYHTDIYFLRNIFI